MPALEWTSKKTAKTSEVLLAKPDALPEPPATVLHVLPSCHGFQVMIWRHGYVQLPTPSGRLESQSDKVPWASHNKFVHIANVKTTYFFGCKYMYIIYHTHWFSCIYVYIVFVCKMAVFQHQTSNEYESIKISVKTHIWKTDINIHRENINGKTRRKPKKKHLCLCLFVSGGHKVPRHFDIFWQHFWRPLP